MKRLPEAVTVKFNELFAVLHSATDDLKIAGAEANLIGDFSQVAALNDSCRKLQALEMDIKATLNNFGSSGNAATVGKASKNKKDRNRTRTANSRIRVVMADKVIEEPTIAETFVKALRVFGLERVAKLNKVVSAVPLLSKTPVNGYQTQKRCDGWFITTHVNKHNATLLLEEIGRVLNMPVKVESIAR